VSSKTSLRRRVRIRVIAPYPVLAKILAKHKPILISKEGWDYIVNWVADVGTVMRSREYMVSVIVSVITQAFLGTLTAVASKVLKGRRYEWS